MTATVLLVHESLPAEVWGPLAEAGAGLFDAEPVEAPPLRTLDRSAWARAIDTVLRARRGAPADLVVGAFGAAGPAASAAAEGRARRAVLLDPDLSVPLADDPSIPIPDPGPEADALLARLAPYHADLTVHGTLPPEGLRLMAELAFGRLDRLDPVLRARLRELAAAKLARCFPIDPASLAPSRDPGGPGDWPHQLARAPGRCAVWTSDRGGLGEATAAAVRRAVPAAACELLPGGSAAPWLEEPRAFAERIRRLIA